MRSVPALRAKQMALRATLYGNHSRIDVARLERLASGFNRFTVDGLPGTAQAGNYRQLLKHET